MKIPLSGVLLLLVLLLGVAFAIAPDKSPPWLSEAQEQALTDSVPPPPAEGSAADLVDVTKVLAAQGARTPQVIAECQRDEKFRYELFADVYGAALTKERAPKFNRLLKDVLEVTRTVNEAAKNKFRRLRPYQGHPDTVHALFTVTGYSYPSGHSMGSFTLAVVLGAIFPDKQKAFLDRAAQIAQSRVDAGVHYPSDIREGEQLGRATGAAIVASAGFQQDLAAAKSPDGSVL